MKQMAKGRDRLLRRMSAAVELEWKWGQMGLLYGDKTAQELKKLIPGDPAILRDYIKITYIMDGKSRKVAEEIMANYTEAEWADSLNRFADIFKKSRDVYLKERSKNSDIWQ